MEAADTEPVFESGKVILAAGKLHLLQVNLTAKCINVDIEDKEFIKRALQLRSVLSSPKSTTDEKESEKKKNGSSSLETLRSITETLSSRGITITVSFKGDRLITLGAGARPRLLQYVTGTRGLAINNVVKLAQMIS